MFNATISKLQKSGYGIGNAEESKSNQPPEGPQELPIDLRNVRKTKKGGVGMKRRGRNICPRRCSTIQKPRGERWPVNSDSSALAEDDGVKSTRGAPATIR